KLSPTFAARLIKSFCRRSRTRTSRAVISNAIAAIDARADGTNRTRIAPSAGIKSVRTSWATRIRDARAYMRVRARSSLSCDSSFWTFGIALPVIASAIGRKVVGDKLRPSSKGIRGLAGSGKFLCLLRTRECPVEALDDGVYLLGGIDVLRDIVGVAGWVSQLGSDL